jgi:ribosomal protein S18 acetylase RimI-like enzyme
MAEPAAAHTLDNPVWNALAGPQRAMADGTGRALRFRPEFAPFCAVPEPMAGDLAALMDVVSPGTGAALVTAGSVALPAGFEVVMAPEVDQMVADRPIQLVAGSPGIVRLSPADVPEMLALVELTKPGPFATRTIEMGCYLGIRVDGRLAAMTGERMHPEGFTEVSAVCTHPDYRGRGYALALLSAVVSRIAERGETPFLHVYPGNAPAIAAYRKLGFERRRALTFTMFRRPA